MESATLERPKEGLGGVEQASPAVKRSNALRSWFEGNVEKGHNKVFSERARVTPELAIMFLERNVNNRKIRKAKLGQLKDDMNNDRFMGLNGETIIFNKYGELHDGQHRLTAILETNKTQDMMVMFGVERRTRSTVDTGVNRSAGDVLTMGGTPYGNNISALARMAIAYERNKREYIGRYNEISASAVIERANNDKLLQEAGAYAGTASAPFKRMVKTSTISFCYYYFSLATSEKQAKTFMESLRLGKDLPSNSPIFLAREYLNTRPKLTPTDKLEVVIRAWNAWIKNVEIKLFRLTGTLPKIEG
jgi:hypothetical protein